MKRKFESIDESTADSSPQEVLKPKGKKLNKKILVIAILFLVITGASSYGVYAWQQSKVDAIAARNSDLEKKSDTTNAKLESLQKDYDSLNEKLNIALAQQNDDSTSTTSAPPVAPALTIKINSATRFNAQGSEGAADTGVAVEITVTNSTSVPLAFSIMNATLQDNQLHVYQILPSYSGLYYPKNYVPMTNQMIQPGASAKGALSFGIYDLDLSSFTFRYDTQSLPFKL